MIHIFSISILIISLLIGIFVFLSIRKQPVFTTQSEWIATNEMGIIERDLYNLKEVILIADSVYVPNKNDYKEIYLSLIDNFFEGVNYNFLVPQNYYDENYSKIIEMYENIRKLTSSLAGERNSIGYFKLHKYPFDKTESDYPYLFYRYKNDNQIDEILAFRGEDVGVGIANNYRRLEPEISKSMLLKALPFIHQESIIEDLFKNYMTFATTDSVINLDKLSQKYYHGDFARIIK